MTTPDQKQTAHTAGRERPILFSGPMVRALLAGRKTQTRRVVKGEALEWLDDSGFTPEFVADPENGLCPYGKPGDRLYVRETWKPHSTFAHLKPRDIPESNIFYRADDAYAPSNTPWKPGIHQPRWASRLTLEVTGVRIERLQDISEADAEAEGVREPTLPPIHIVSAEACGEVIRENAPAGFLWRMLWSGINGSESWDANPWVWAVSFTVRGEARATGSSRQSNGDPS